MINYLLEKVDREKIVCYQLGTKIEMVWDEEPGAYLENEYRTRINTFSKDD